jgi:hypothetical protein
MSSKNRGANQTPAVGKRVKDGIAICPDLCTYNNAYHLLHFPSLTFRLEKPLKDSTGLSGQIIKPANKA